MDKVAVQLIAAVVLWGLLQAVLPAHQRALLVLLLHQEVAVAVVLEARQADRQVALRYQHHKAVLQAEVAVLEAHQVDHLLLQEVAAQALVEVQEAVEVDNEDKLFIKNKNQLFSVSFI